jgi:tetratricopeptide (TPR) repeat protein
MVCWLLGRALQETGSAQHALPHLNDARRRFEAIAQAPSEGAAAAMASACVTEKGDCLRALGRLDEAAAAYEESNRLDEQRGDERGLAVGKCNLAAVRLRQGHYGDALEAYAEARAHFTKLGEPGSVAVVWHQTGMAYREAKQPEAAEDAYRKSLASKVQLGDVGGQASTLNALGTLYDDLDRREEAASLFRSAADQYVGIGDTRAEGGCRNNLGQTLHRLGRWDDAPQAIRGAIESGEPFGHVAQPWSRWAILAAIEIGAGDARVAALARANAVTCYLAYRRDGGENHDADSRVSLAVTEKLLAGDAVGAASSLDELLAHPELPNSLRPFVAALRAIAAGSRDRSLAEAPDL